MLQCDRDALLCDFAETYHIYSFEGLPVRTLAALASGLRDDSRIKMQLSGAKISMRDAVAVATLDRLTWLAWAKSEDGKHGRNRPKSLLSILMGEEKEDEIEAFQEAEDFEDAWEEITGVKHGGR